MSSSDSKKVHKVRLWATAILCGWHRPNFWGQDGQVVKTGALGDAHFKSWDRTWSSPDSKEVHIGRCDGSRGQDGRVVKAGALGDTHVKSWDQTR